VVGLVLHRQVIAMTTTTLLPFQPDAMTPAQGAAVSYLARYSGHTHALYASQLRRWFAWCETNGLEALVGIQRAHIELYIRHLGESGLMASSVNTSMHAVRGFSGSPTSTASSSPTQPSTHASPRSTATSPAPRAWTGSS
jgi:site-specific recombinase XerC